MSKTPIFIKILNVLNSFSILKYIEIVKRTLNLKLICKALFGVLTSCRISSSREKLIYYRSRCVRQHPGEKKAVQAAAATRRRLTRTGQFVADPAAGELQKGPQTAAGNRRDDPAFKAPSKKFARRNLVDFGSAQQSSSWHPTRRRHWWFPDV